MCILFIEDWILHHRICIPSHGVIQFIYILAYICSTFLVSKYFAHFILMNQLCLFIHINIVWIQARNSMHSCIVCSNYPLSISLFIKVGYYFNHEPESTYMVCNVNGLVISFFAQSLFLVLGLCSKVKSSKLFFFKIFQPRSRLISKQV